MSEPKKESTEERLRESIIQKFALNFKIFARTDCQHACVQRAVQRRLEDHLNLASF